MELRSDHTDRRRDVSTQPDLTDLNGREVANIREDTPTLEQGEMVRSSGRRAPSFSSDIPDNCSDAGPSDTVDHIASHVRSSPTRPTSASAGAVAADSSPVHPTGSDLADPDRYEPADISSSFQTQKQSSMTQSPSYRMTPCTGETQDSAGDPGPSDIPGRAAPPAKSFGAQPISGEALVRRSSMSRSTDPAALSVTEFAVPEPEVPPHSAADQDERLDDARTMVRQGSNCSVESIQHPPQQAHTSSTDFDDLMLIVEDIKNMPANHLNIVWNQLSEKFQHRTADQWKCLYMDKVLPTFEAQRLIASFAARRQDRPTPGRSGSDIQQSSQNVRPTCTALHATRDNDNTVHKSRPVTHRHEVLDRAQQSAALPPSGPTSEQMLQSRDCI